MLKFSSFLQQSEIDFYSHHQDENTMNIFKRYRNILKRLKNMMCFQCFFLKTFFSILDLIIDALSVKKNNFYQYTSY